MQNKSMLMDFDSIVKICMDFYSRDEVVAARQLIEQHSSSSGSRLARRQGGNMVRSTLEDILELILNPHVMLPTFFAVSMERIPPVDVSHCDVSAILRELQSLRTEVRMAAGLRDDLDGMHKELTSVRKELSDPPQKVATCESLSSISEDWPQLPTASNSTRPANGVTGRYGSQSVKSFAEHAQDATTIRKAFSNKAVRNPVVGSSNDVKLKSVRTTRSVDLFVSRLHPHTVEGELRECVESLAAANDVPISDLQFVKLKPRYEGLYCSFYVTFRVDANLLSRAVELYMSDNSWSHGVFVKRYYKPKNGAT